MKKAKGKYIDINIEIAEQLYLWMQRERLTKTKAAKRLGFSRPYIYELLNGKRNFTILALCEIMEKIGIEVNVEFKGV